MTAPTPDALAQYIELYEAEAPVIAGACDCEPLNSARQAAYAALRDTPFTLPRRGQEGYHSTDLNKAFLPDYGLNIRRIKAGADTRAAFRRDVPLLSPSPAIVVNDTPHFGRITGPAIPGEVWFGSLALFGRENPTLLETYYGSIAPLRQAEVALNTLLVQDGVVLYVPRGVKVSRPLQIVNLMSAAVDVMAVRRLMIIMEEESEATIITCDHTMDCDRSYLSSAVGEIYLGRNSRLSIFDIEEASALTSRVAGIYITQKAGSQLRLGSAALWSGSSRCDFVTTLEEAGAEAHLSGLVTGNGGSLTDIHTRIEHRAPGCTSRQLFKFALPDAARGAFEGQVYVGHGATGTDASQTCRNILTGADARMHTEPQLEIYCDDVKASHGAATGQLSADALFYMRQRGIPEAEARAMLLQAFMADVIDTFEPPALADRLRHLVEKRLSGSGPEPCETCGVPCAKTETL